MVMENACVDMPALSDVFCRCCVVFFIMRREEKRSGLCSSLSCSTSSFLLVRLRGRGHPSTSLVSYITIFTNTVYTSCSGLIMRVGLRSICGPSCKPKAQIIFH